MLYKLDCLNCNTSFDSKRPQSKYCSGKCRVAYSRKSKFQKTVAPVTQKVVDEGILKEALGKSSPKVGEKMSKAILALIKDRRAIVGKAYGDHAIFHLGNTTILLGMSEIIIGDTKYKLGKPKKK